MAKQIVFDKDAFVGKVRSDVITLESKVEKYLADILQKEAKTNVNDDFKNTLAKFKASINVYSTAISTTSTKVSFPEEVYKVLLAGHAVKYAPQIKKIDGTLIKEMEAYIADILGTGKTVTTADGKSYEVDDTFAQAGLATVTYDGRRYILNWRSDSAKESLYSLLRKLKTWGQNFESYFFNELKKDALDALLGTWVKALLSKNKYIAEEVYDSFKNFLDAGGDATNIPLLANDNFSKWLSDLTKKRFPDTNKEIAALQEKYKKLDDLARDTDFLKDYKAEPDSTADAIKNTVTGLTSYKNFLKAYNDLQTAIGQSTSNFDSIIPNYIGYEISNVVSDTFSENNATITCMDGNNNIEITGSNVSVDTGRGNDTIQSGSYSESNSKVKIHAGDGDDEIYNYSSDSTLDGGAGEDFIRSDSKGTNVSISGGDGFDTIDSHGNHNIIDGGAGNDSISNYGDNVTISGDDGADTIRSYGSDSSVFGGAGDDEILVMSSYVDGGTGVDTISIQGSYVTAYGGGSFDYLPTKDVFNISSGASNVYINDFEFGDVLNLPAGSYTARIEFGSTAIRDSSGKLIVWLKNFTDRLENFTYDENGKQTSDGDDSINNDVSNIKIDLGAGNDTIDNHSNNVTINGGAGNDSIENSGNLVSINGGNGDDTIDNEVLGYSSGGSNVTMDGNAGNDSIENDGDYNQINGGAGNDSIYNWGSNATLDGGTGNDEIYSSGSNVSVDAGADNDIVFNGGYYDNNGFYADGGSFVTIKAGDGDDSIINHGSDVLIDTGDGDDSIHNYVDNVSIESNYGNDRIENDGNNVVIESGEDNDAISNSGDNVTINSGDGHEVIVNSGNYILINGGEGHEVIGNSGSNVTIDGGEGDDSIKSYVSDNSSIICGAGNDTIINLRPIVTDINKINDTIYSYATISGGADNDYIYNYCNDVTIDGGAGDDYINNGIYDYNIGVYYGNNDNVLFLYSAGDGNDTIQGFNSTSTLSISGSEYTRSTVGNDVIIKVGDGLITLKDAKGKMLNIDGTEVVDEPVWKLNGKIATYGTIDNTLVTVSGVKSLDGLSLSGKVVTVSASALGTETVTISEGYTLALAQGVDTIKEDLYGWTTLSSGNVAYLTGGTGSYYSLSSNGKTITYNAALAGANQVELSGVKGTPTLDNNFVSLTANNFASNVSLVSNAGGFQFVLSDNFDGKSFTGTDSLLGSTVSDTIHNHGQCVSINTGAGDDYLYSYADKVTIDAGTGDDYIHNNGPNVLFNYRAGDGNDSINGFNAISTLSISGGTYSTQQRGNDVIVTVGDGKITLASATSLSALNINGEEQTVSTTLTLDNNSAAKQTLPAQIVTADATKRTSATRIVGNALNNSILGGTGKDTLYGGNGADYLEGGKGNDKLYGQASNDTLDGGIGNDYLSGYTGNDSLNGGAGNDTLLGGTGNDTLTGGAGNDLFVYSAGKDVITDYATGDKISINAAVTASSVKGSDATFTIGSNTLTVKDGKGKEVVFIDAQDTERTIVGGTYLSTDSMKSPVTISSWRQVGDASERTTAIKLTGNSLDNTLLGGSGKDTLYGKDGNDYLVGNDGNDKLYGQVGNDTLIGGAGNDTLTGGDGNDLFVFDAGNDFISDYATDDKISVNAEITASSVVGSNATFTIGSNTLTVKNGKGAEIVFLDADGNERTIIGGAFVATNSTSTKNTLASLREVGDASARTSAIYLVGNVLGNTLLGGSGKDSLYGKDGDDFIQGNAGADSLYGQNGDDTLWGGIGNDTLKGGDGDDLFIYSGGNDVITDYASGDKISLGMAVTSASLKGSDAILTTDGGKLTIKNAKDLTLIDSFGTEMTTIIGSATYDNNATTKVTLPSGIEIGDASSRTTAIKITGNSLDNSILGGVGKDSLYGGKGNDYIQGGDGNDKIWGQDGNDTLSGGAGNDSMSGGNGANLFIYEFGKDYITDFSATDTLQIGDGTGTYSTQVSGSDIIVTVGDGSITLKDAASLSAVNILGEEISPIEIYDKSSAAKVTLASGIEVGDASARTAAIRIVGNALDNTIFGGAGKDTLYGKDGNDYISGSTGNDKLYGQNGNDTLWGGSGNDTFTGGAGADTFIYNSGEGKDVISDFSNDDLLQITGTFSATYDSSANTISFKVGSTASAITLKNFTATSFKVNDDSYLISGSKLVTK